MITNIFVRSRKEMEQESYKISTPSIIITITDVNKNNIVFPVNNDIIDVLELKFEDSDKKDNNSITDKDADNITEFIFKYNKKKEDIICYVNCEAGLSRSAGIAAAISKYLFDDDKIFFQTKIPNMLCYRTVLNKFYGII